MVAAEAKHASEVVGTMGVALSVCTLPGQVTSDRLGPRQMELGLGIVSLNCICYYACIIKQLAYLGVGGIHFEFLKDYLLPLICVVRTLIQGCNKCRLFR